MFRNLSNLLIYPEISGAYLWTSCDATTPFGALLTLTVIVVGLPVARKLRFVRDQHTQSAHWAPGLLFRRHILHSRLQEQSHILGSEFVALAVRDAHGRNRVLGPARVNTGHAESLLAGGKLAPEIFW